MADAKAVAQTLKQRGYEVTELYNERATKRAIESELRTKLPRKVGEHDRVLIFYAGHGKDERVKGGKAMGYLLPVDGEQEDIPATGVSMGTVRELADALPAKHVLFLLDVCFGGIAGTLTRGAPPAVTEAYLKQITRERGRHLITAGGADQEVIESAQWGHSVFTYFLLKGLNEGLADQDDNGVITAQELYTYLESRVFGEAQQQGHTQTPQMAELSGEKGQFVFLTSTRKKAGGNVALSVSPRPETAILSAGLSKAEQELQALETQERQVEEESRQADLLRQIDEKKRQIEEKKTNIQVARARPYDVPQQMGKEITGKDGASMVLVPEGEFLYGYKKDRRSLPAFYMDLYEVTTGRYAAFLQATGAGKEPKYWGDVRPVSDGELPVAGVEWEDADAYCRWAGKRLPTDQEWEKAARGTDGRTYPWGNASPSPSLANYENGFCGPFCNVYAEKLKPVNSYKGGRSPYGIYNMAGNVWEWVEEKVIRGGSWNNTAYRLPASDRYGSTPSLWLSSYGIRCAQDAS